MVTSLSEVTWKELVEAEPRLAGLLEEVKAVQDDGGPVFCANAVWYGYGPYWDRGFKERMSELVGWGRTVPPAWLHTPRAYDVAYDTLYAPLPNCRNCLCA